MAKKFNKWVLLGFFIFGIILSFTKLAIGGGTFLEYNMTEWVIDTVGIIFFFTLVGVGFASLKIHKSIKYILPFVIAILLAITVTFTAILDRLSLGRSVDLNFGEVFITSSIVILLWLILAIIFAIIPSIIYFFIKQKASILLLLIFIVTWMSTIFLLINDMTENLNIGGPNGNWYLIGNAILLVGLLIIYIVTPFIKRLFLGRKDSII